MRARRKCTASTDEGSGARHKESTRRERGVRKERSGEREVRARTRGAHAEKRLAPAERLSELGRQRAREARLIQLHHLRGGEGGEVRGHGAGEVRAVEVEVAEVLEAGEGGDRAGE